MAGRGDEEADQSECSLRAPAAVPTEHVNRYMYIAGRIGQQYGQIQNFAEQGASAKAS